MADLDGTDERFDSEDVIERIEELENEREEWVIGDRDEYAALTEFRDKYESEFSDWKYGVLFIRDDRFEEYAEEYAGDIGAIDPNAGWPLDHIDWNAAAEDLKEEFTEVEFMGETYWGRD